jgi:hypothetical protein
MKMNRKIAALGVLSLILTVMTALALINAPPGAKGSAVAEDAGVMAAADAAEMTDDPAERPEESAKQYILKDVSGFIGIYDPDDMESPKMVTGIVVDKLRAADVKMLANGILVTGEEQLARLLEDFGS